MSAALAPHTPAVDALFHEATEIAPPLIVTPPLKFDAVDVSVSVPLPDFTNARVS